MRFFLVLYVYDSLLVSYKVRSLASRIVPCVEHWWHILWLSQVLLFELTLRVKLTLISKTTTDCRCLLKFTILSVTSRDQIWSFSGNSLDLCRHYIKLCL